MNATTPKAGYQPCTRHQTTMITFSGRRSQDLGQKARQTIEETEINFLQLEEKMMSTYRYQGN